MNDISRSAPPHFVPTLTDVVRPNQPLPLALPAEFANLLEGWPGSIKVSQPLAPEPTGQPLDAALHDRIVSRIERALASDLQASIDSVVELHTRAFKVALQSQISAVLLEAVTQALQQETATPQSENFQS
jgi:hypothetical protein